MSGGPQRKQCFPDPAPASSRHPGDDHALGNSRKLYSIPKEDAAPQKELTPGQIHRDFLLIHGVHLLSDRPIDAGIPCMKAQDLLFFLSRPFLFTAITSSKVMRALS